MRHLKCSPKASMVLFCIGKKSSSRSSILARLSNAMRSSSELSTRYSLNVSVTKESTVPFATRLSLRSAAKIVSGGSPDNFWEKVRAVKTANFFRSSTPYSSCWTDHQQELHCSNSRPNEPQGTIRHHYISYARYFVFERTGK